MKWQDILALVLRVLLAAGTAVVGAHLGEPAAGAALGTAAALAVVRHSASS